MEEVYLRSYADGRWIAPVGGARIDVFNRATDGPSCNVALGTALDVDHAVSGHADVDMISFTGSNRAGIEIACTSDGTIKRVHQESGGKSPNIILRSAVLETTVAGRVAAVMLNSGQRSGVTCALTERRSHAA